MKNAIKNLQPVVFVLLLGTAFTTIAWQSGSNTTTHTKENNYQRTKHIRDTTEPRKYGANENEYRINDVDKAMKELDKTMEKLNEELREMDFSAMDREIKASLAKVDIDKVKQQVEKALQTVNWDKIRTDVNISLKQAEENMKKLDMEKLTKNLEVLQEELQREEFTMKLNAERTQKPVDENLQKAKEGIVKAKVELKNLKEFTDALEKDGLINRKKGFKIELQDEDLYINGTKQSKAITGKYRRYYKKENFIINSDGDSNISL